VGKGGAGRFERAAVSVRQHDFVESGELRRSPIGICLRCQSDEWHEPGVQWHESRWLVCAERVWALRHGGERVAVVLGLVWIVFERFAERPAWSRVRLLPCVSGRLEPKQRDLLPGGGSQLLRLPDPQQRRRRIPLRPGPHRTASNYCSTDGPKHRQGRLRNIHCHSYRRFSALLPMATERGQHCISNGSITDAHQCPVWRILFRRRKQWTWDRYKPISSFDRVQRWRNLSEL